MGGHFVFKSVTITKPRQLDWRILRAAAEQRQDLSQAPSRTQASHGHNGGPWRHFGSGGVRRHCVARGVIPRLAIQLVTQTPNQLDDCSKGTLSICLAGYSRLERKSKPGH